MREFALIAAPLLTAALAVVWPSERTRPWLLPAAGLLIRSVLDAGRAVSLLRSFLEQAGD